MRDVKSEILKFWFEDTKPAQWFQKNPDFDAEITARFENDYTLASHGIYDGWMHDANASLALIILLDQFPRNMYRDTPKMFATDAKALEIAKHAINKKYDTMMSVNKKVFMYLPFEHSEDIAAQETSMALFKSTKDTDPTYYTYAKRHYDVIKKFGRFPHRNEILDRPSTKLEEEYLSKPDSGF